MIAEVIVSINSKAVDRVFDYEVPAQFESLTKSGMRVAVPFGRRDITGFVLATKQESDYDKVLRKITKLIDEVPVLNEELMQLSIELARDTGATRISCFEAMVPNVNLSKKMKKYIKLVNPQIDLAQFSRSKKQLEIVEALLTSATPIARENLDVSAPILKSLRDKGVIYEVEVEVYRDPFAAQNAISTHAMVLNDEQQQAVSRLLQASNQEFLLYGVTGSGKTEVYLQAIAEVLVRGQQAVVLVPEITLTTQITARFKARFGEQVAVLHSGLSQGERYDEWRRILRGEARVVVGARSAIFAPLQNIGLIIVDEEHEASFKQEEMPRYHACEVAKWRGKFHDCPVVFGSATPSLESYARASKGIYELIALKNRAVASSSVPAVRMIDMGNGKQMVKNGPLSQELESAIRLRMTRGEQVILFLNRRGYANFMQCRECNEVVSCPNCDVTLTYHKQGQNLRCHYCNFSADVVQSCPKCESPEVRFFGTGTQKVEEFLATEFPEAKVLRMDVDTTSKKGDHKRIIESFGAREAEILLGTQMVAKGLDFEGVTLVGVLDADLMLHLPDYKAAERTFQILTQVAGRSGRHLANGEVLIQTYSPNHHVMKCVQAADYESFYVKEMQARRQFNYPPYFYLASIMLSSEDYEQLVIYADKTNRYLRQKLGQFCQIIGPTMPPVARVNNRFKMYFIVKYREERNLRDVLRQLVAHFQASKVLLSIDYFPNKLT